MYLTVSAKPELDITGANIQIVDRHYIVQQARVAVMRQHGKIGFLDMAHIKECLCDVVAFWQG